MKKLLLTFLLTISPILAQCDWNEDDQVDVLDVVATVDCIMSNCWENIGTTVTDIDGNVYQTITIGDQIWMAENLKVTHYSNGDEIPTVSYGVFWSDLGNLEIGAFSVYDEDIDLQSQNTCNGNCAEVYGNLYNWYAVDDSRGVCPEGFHIPTDDEWMELEFHLGMPESELYDEGYRGTDQGSQLAGNADLWIDGNLVVNPAFGTSGFNSLPGGYKTSSGSYVSTMGYIASFWSSTAYDSNNSWRRYLGFNDSGVARTTKDKRFGKSVRCKGD
jgi:uncharacterized protein (TIGR02145 family)